MNKETAEGEDRATTGRRDSGAKNAAMAAPRGEEKQASSRGSTAGSQRVREAGVEKEGATDLGGDGGWGRARGSAGGRRQEAHAESITQQVGAGTCPSRHRNQACAVWQGSEERLDTGKKTISR